MSLSVYNPFGAKQTDGSVLANNLSGMQGEQLGADLHGPWYNANLRRTLYHFVVNEVTLGVMGIPQQTNGLSSVFALSNPTSSGVNAEIVSTTVTHSSATTVAGDLNWSTIPATSTQSAVAVTPTLTKAVALTNYFSGRIGDNPNGQVIPYTAASFTTTGGGLTSFKIDCVGTIGGTSDSTMQVLDKYYYGRLILPPGQTIYFGSNGLCASCNLQVVWAEWPFA